MELSEEGVYTYTTMCPPGEVFYFFTIDKIATYAKDHSKVNLSYSKIITHVEQYDEIKSYKIHKFNLRIVSQEKVLDENYNSLLTTCVPRPKLK